MSITFKQYLLEQVSSSAVAGRHITTQELSSAAKRGNIAKKLGLSAVKLKNMSDSEIKAVLNDVGEHDFAPDSDFDADQLRKGTKIEYEHTKSELVAKLIAKDHLAEIPDYYTRLAKMEKAAGKDDD